jgi:hypothetical protein
VHAHRRRVEDAGARENESAGVRTERERIEELRVYQLAKALSSAPAWTKSTATQGFPIDAPLSARLRPRELESPPPAYEEPAHADTVHEEPAHEEPAHADTVHEEPVHAEPVHEEPVRTESAHSDARSSSTTSSAHSTPR